MSINYFPDDEVFSSFQPHLNQQSIDIDGILKACELGATFPDVYDIPPYQTLGQIYPTDPDTGIYGGDDNQAETRIAHTGDGIGIDIDELFSIGESPYTSDGKQTGTIIEVHPEEEIGTLEMDPLDKGPPTKENENENTTENAMLNSTPLWDVLNADTPSSLRTRYCHCCDEVAVMRRQVRNIFFGNLQADFHSDIEKILVGLSNIQRGLHSFSYDVSLVIENVQQWMVENDERKD
ncbi:hypothetical protein FGG08_000640 [Glutinoglossum americanum]|uniref:Uncharacterized protein n=1 Tax=Glutinoglossum americanum TaxID=1670608 RepID=A0A9P8I3L4_9PEZI|nr:hypothetical protein FGG08_000640 [Glutinoglossum americanum]